MKIIHKIGFLASEEKIRALNDAGVHIEKENQFISVEIEECDPRWANISSIVKDLKLLDTVITKFSEEEIRRAAILEMVPAWHYSYPQPEDNFGYKEKTYDLSDFCHFCGIGSRQQIAPFSLKRPPGWGTKSILQLNWVFDEYFVKPDVWHKVFKPFGIECMPVLLYKTGQEMDNIVQLVISSFADVRLEGHEYTICQHCGQRKYLPITRGFQPKPDVTDAAIFKSKTFFGSGASAHRMVFINSRLYKAIAAEKIKGVTFKPTLE